MAEDELINLRHDVDRHEDAVIEDARQIASLKAEMKELKNELKDGIRELIDAVEDLATAKEAVHTNSQAEVSALERFHRRIEGLKQHFKTEDAETA